MDQQADSSTPVALVTGAGRGVGRATAQALNAEGYATVLVGRTESALRETADTLTHPALPYPADLTEPGVGERVIRAALERFGRLDVLANVAGWAKLLTMDELTPELWQQNVATNLSAVVELTAAAWPTFRKQGGGTIVNVSSMAAYDPFPGLGAYAAAKVGVNMFTKVTAEEGEPIGVQAVCIVPGAVETPMLRSLFSTDTLSADQTLEPAQVAALITDCVVGRRRFKPGEAITITP